MTIEFTFPDGRAMTANQAWDYCGFLPSFLSVFDPRGAVEQIDSSYGHGGGWLDSVTPFKVATDRMAISYYPEDGPFRAVAKAKLRDEEIVLYEHAYVGVFQPDGSHRIARID